MKKHLVRKASGGMLTPDDIIYLDYPGYEGSGTKGYPGAEIAKAAGVPEKLPVGHNAFILVDDNGGTQFYEYGRYDKDGNGTILGTYKPGKGNWVRRKVDDITERTESGDIDYETYLKNHKLPHGSGAINATVIKDTNNDAVRGYINNVASKSWRLPYNLANTCATLASIATQIGMATSPKRLLHSMNPIEGIKGMGSRIITGARNLYNSKGWSLLPGSSQLYGIYMSGFGDTYRLNK